MEDVWRPWLTDKPTTIVEYCSRNWVNYLCLCVPIFACADGKEQNGLTWWNSEHLSQPNVAPCNQVVICLGYLSAGIGFELIGLICFLTPLVLAFLAVQAWVVFEGTTFEDYEYSSGWEAFGWLLELTPIIVTALFPLYLVFKFYRLVIRHGNYATGSVDSA